MEKVDLQSENESAKTYKLKQRPFVGYVSWLIQRITALILLVALPLKIYSGYATTGQVPGNSFISALHINAVLDTALVFALIFHALYGFRVILIDFGIVTDNRSVFKAFTWIGAILSAVAFYIIVS